jgi:hypothetical protein
MDRLRSLLTEDAAPSATIWCILRYQAACDALRAGDHAEATAQLIAYARDELRLWAAGRAGQTLCAWLDPTLGAVQVRVGARRPEEPLQLAHGAILSRDPALLADLGAWTLDPAARVASDIAIYTATMIDALLATLHRLPTASLLNDAARHLIPHNLDAGRRWCDQLSSIIRGQHPAPPDRFFDREWAQPDSEDYRAFWTLGAHAMSTLLDIALSPQDNYARLRASRDADPAEVAARLAPRQGFCWPEDVRSVLSAGSYELAARFEADDDARADGAAALVDMLHRALSRLDDEGQATARAIIATAPAMLAQAMAPSLARRAESEALARYEAQGEAARDLSTGARLALRHGGDTPALALAWLTARHPGADRAKLASALLSHVSIWSKEWIESLYDELGEQGARPLLIRSATPSYFVANAATGARWPLLWTALEIALGEDRLGTGARTLSIAPQLIRRDGAAQLLRERFEAQPAPLRATLIRWLELQLPPPAPPAPPAPTATDALLSAWEAELEPIVVDAPPGTPTPRRRRRRDD